MYDVLFEHLREKVELPESDEKRVSALFEPETLRKRQFLLQEGDYCKKLSFVSKGAIKCYTLDEKGNEHINLLATEGWWASDFRSFIHGEKAVLSIDAIEETQLLLISRDSYEELLAEVPVMERYFRILYQNSLVTKDKRLISYNSYTAEEKYQEFLEMYPSLAQRIPQNLIASYLGLAPETISRVKKSLWQ